MNSKLQQLQALDKGDRVWASMSTWYDAQDIERTEYPLSAQQLDMHLVEGKIVKKLKRSVDVTFEAMQEGTISSLSNDDIIRSSKTYLSPSNFPEGCVIVKSEDDIDYLQGKASSLSDIKEMSLEDQVRFLLERDQCFRKILKKQWEEELLIYKLNSVEAIPPATLVLKLPRIFGTIIEERTDVIKTDALKAEELEKIRESLVIKMSIKTNTCDNLSGFLGFRVELIEKLNKKLQKKSSNGIIEVEIITSLLFAQEILVPAFTITQCFKEMKNQGSAEFVSKRMIGNLKGIKLLGVHASKHPRWANPFLAVEYQDSIAGEIGPYYDNLRIEHGGELPYVINPWELKNEEDFINPVSKVRNELGDEYSYDCSPYKMRYDMEIGRLKAPTSSSLRNFGMKRWAMLSSAEEDVMVDFIQPCEGSAGCRIIMTFRVEVAQFSAANDEETGRMTEFLRDV